MRGALVIVAFLPGRRMWLSPVWCLSWLSFPRLLWEIVGSFFRLSMGPTVVIVACREMHAIVSCLFVLGWCRPLGFILLVIDLVHFVELSIVWLGGVCVVYVGVIREVIFILLFFCDDR